MKMYTKTAILFTGLVIVGIVAEASAAELADLKVEPENRCAPYSAKAYKYSALRDRDYVEQFGYVVRRHDPLKGMLDRGFPSPYYHGISFRFLQDMDIEHIVARSEAHDSGLCAYPERWSEFANDMDNLTVAAEHPNRTLKRDKDPADWMPEIRRCEYAQQWIDVKAKYGLSVDEAERAALDEVLSGC